MKALTPPRLLLVSAVLLTVTSGCKRNSDVRNDPEWWRLENSRMELAHDVDLLKLRLAKVSDTRDEMAIVNRELEGNVARISELKALQAELRRDTAAFVAAAEAERTRLIRQVRASAAGKEFDSFTGSRGRTYEKVVITKISDIGVEFRHEAGSTRLSAADLTPEQHLAFGLDPLAARKALDEEKANAAVLDAWLGERVLVANEAKARAERDAAAREAETELAAARLRSTVRDKRLASIELPRESRLRAQPRSFGSGTYWSGSYGSRSYGSRYYYKSSYSGSCYYPGFSCRSGAGYATYRSPRYRSTMPLHLRQSKAGVSP